MFNRRYCLLSLLSLAAMLMLVPASLVFAQSDYPSKPVRLVVPWPPAGPVDLTARIIGQKLTEGLGRQIIIDNRAGADGSIGVAFAAKAPADGYTLLLGSTSTHSINPIIFNNLTYDTVKDFAPVILLDTRPYILLVHPTVSANSVRELVALAKSKRGELAYASAGASNQAAGEEFKTGAGVDILHVPYQGGGPAMNALLGGQVSLFFAPVPLAIPHIQSARVKALAVTSARRITSMPNVPTMSEGGLPGFEFSTWEGLLVPAGTPRAIVMKLNAEMAGILDMPDVREKFSALGASTSGGTPDQLSAHMKLDAEKWARSLKASGIRIE